MGWGSRALAAWALSALCDYKEAVPQQLAESLARLDGHVQSMGVGGAGANAGTGGTAAPSGGRAKEAVHDPALEAAARAEEIEEATAQEVAPYARRVERALKDERKRAGESPLRILTARWQQGVDSGCLPAS